MYRRFFLRTTIAGELASLQVQELADPVEALSAPGSGWERSESNGDESFEREVMTIDRAGTVFDPPFRALVRFEVVDSSEDVEIPEEAEGAIDLGGAPLATFLGTLEEHSPECGSSTDPAWLECMEDSARSRGLTVARAQEVYSDDTCPIG